MNKIVSVLPIFPPRKMILLVVFVYCFSYQILCTVYLFTAQCLHKTTSKHTTPGGIPFQRMSQDKGKKRKRTRGRRRKRTRGRRRKRTRGRRGRGQGEGGERGQGEEEEEDKGKEEKEDKGKEEEEDKGKEEED